MLQEWIIKYSQNVREKYDISMTFYPRGPPGRVMGWAAELTHDESSAISSPDSKEIKMVQRQGGTSLPLIAPYLLDTGGLFQNKIIDTVTISCLTDKKNTFGIKHLDSKPSSATYCVIQESELMSLSFNLVTGKTGIQTSIYQDFFRKGSIDGS